MMADTVLLACSAMETYIRAAQERVGTAYPVVYVDKTYHEQPKEMRLQLIKALEELPEEVHTVLVAMGFCGGAWEAVSTKRRLVIPKVDDCVTLLLYREETGHRAQKEMGHLYLTDHASDIFAPEAIYQKYCEQFDQETARMLLDMYFEHYTTVDVVDTGVWDCRAEDCRREAEKNAELIHCRLQYVPGSNRMLERLLSGQWDDLFWVLEPGEMLQNDAVSEL